MLFDTLLVPELDDNLISVQGLTDHGTHVSFTSTTCTITRNSSKFTLAKRTSHQYYADVLPIVSSTSICAHEWHKKMAHKHLSAVRKMKDHGIIISPCSCSDDCSGCLGGKSKTKSFPKQAEKPKNRLDIIVSDICGPLPTKDILLIFPNHHRCFLRLHRSTSIET